MAAYTTTRTIDAPPAVVWRVLADVSKWPDWAPTVTSIEPLDGDTLAVGRRYRLVQPKLGQAVWRVTSLEPEHSFTWESRSSGVVATAEHLIERRSEESTTVTLAVELDGPLAWLGSLMAGKLTREYIEQEADALKRSAEALRAADEA